MMSQDQKIKHLSQLLNKNKKLIGSIPFSLAYELLFEYREIPNFKEYAKEHKICESTIKRKFYILMNEGFLIKINNKWFINSDYVKK